MDMYEFKEEEDDDFFQPEDVYGITLGDFDRTTPISPIFQPSSFLNADWDVMRPVLQLASFLLTSRPLLPFWDMLFYQPNVGSGANCEMLRNHKGPLTDVEADDTLNAMVTLGAMLTFKHTRECGDPSCGSTACMPECVDKTGTFLGVGSLIEFSTVGYNQLASYDEGFDVAHQLLLRYEMAITLCHEIAHAAWHARTDGARPEPFFEDHIFAECGYAWEAFVMEGTIHHFPAHYLTYTYQTPTEMRQLLPDNTIPEVPTSSLQGVICIQEFPSALTINQYRFHGHSMGLRAEPPNSDLQYRVPLAYFENLFTTRFWKDFHDRGDARALLPPTYFPFVSRDDKQGHRKIFKFDWADKPGGNAYDAISISSDGTMKERSPSPVSTLSPAASPGKMDIIDESPEEYAEDDFVPFLEPGQALDDVSDFVEPPYSQFDELMDDIEMMEDGIFDEDEDLEPPSPSIIH